MKKRTAKCDINIANLVSIKKSQYFSVSLKKCLLMVALLKYLMIKLVINS